MKVKDIMTKDIKTVSKETTVQEVARILVEKNITSVSVVDEDNRVVGIISENDLICKDVDPALPATMEYLGGIIFLTGIDNYEAELKKLTATKAEQMMSEDVITVEPNNTVKELGRLLIDENIHSVPVVEADKLVGIVTSSDIVKTLL